MPFDKAGMNQEDLVQWCIDMQAAFNQLRTEYNTLVAKLNADTGVIDTNYAVTTSAAVSGANAKAGQ